MMSDVVVPATFLDWDTNFWGYRIALVEEFTEVSAPLLDKWVSDQRIDCLYLRLDPDNPHSIHLAESSDFRLMDIRMDFRRGLGANPLMGKSAESAVRNANTSDTARLARIAMDAHADSRFFADPRFPDSACRDFYARWITESVNGYADAVLVADIHDQVAGYVTGHFDDGVGRIGLIAVAGEFQGQGFGSILTRAMLGRFSGEGLSTARVATQANNKAGQLLYQRNGFAVERVQLTFHRWFANG